MLERMALVLPICLCVRPAAFTCYRYMKAFEARSESSLSPKRKLSKVRHNSEESEDISNLFIVR